jgi:hypothetical protein
MTALAIRRLAVLQATSSTESRKSGHWPRKVLPSLARARLDYRRPAKWRVPPIARLLHLVFRLIALGERVTLLPSVAWPLKRAEISFSTARGSTLLVTSLGRIRTLRLSPAGKAARETALPRLRSDG